MIYFISDGNYIKVGRAEAPEQRLRDLQTGHPNRLILLFAVFGGAFEEKRYHAAFEKYHHRGEWYKPDIIRHMADALPLDPLWPGEAFCMLGVVEQGA